MKKIYQNIASATIAGLVAILPVNSAFALSQDETVYVKLQDSGVPRNISVTKHLLNDDKSATLLDQTILQNLENLNGFEDFHLDGKIVSWQAAGRDIYYRGTTNQELPIKLEVTYQLNGQKSSVEKMLGQSGRVDITLKYTNLSKVGDLYTPFVTAVATALDETKVSNVQVTNGKLTSTGRTIAVAAVAAPGLYESLGIAELKDTDQVVLSYETSDFELNDIYTVVTPKLLDSADLKTFTDLDNLYAQADQLAASSAELSAGATRLKQGVAKLSEKMGSASQNLQSLKNPLDLSTITSIKSAASASAAAQIAAQRSMIETSVKQQVTDNSILMNALKLQAAEMCKAQAGVDCPETNVVALQGQLAQTLQDSMVESSLQLAQTVGQATAETTAETVATGINQQLTQTLAPNLDNMLGQMSGAVNQILQGATELSAGMARFDREGIQPLANFVNGQLKVTTEKIQRLGDLSAAYNNYAGIAPDASGETKFILMIDGRKPAQQ